MSEIKKRKSRKRILKTSGSETLIQNDPLLDLMNISGIFDEQTSKFFDSIVSNNAVVEPRNILLETKTFLKDQLDYVSGNIQKLQTEENHLISLEEELNTRIQNMQTEKNNIYFQKVNLVEQENMLKNLVQQMEFNI